jgi:hypothetical protein
MRRIALVLAVLASPAAVAQNPYDDGYKRGYKEGFSEGYRKAQQDQQNAPPPVLAPPPVILGPINIQVARYGSSNKICDATRQVRLKAQGKRVASIDVSNSLCGDPDPGQRKELEVSYTCGSVAKTASAYEHRTAYLDCSS